MEGLAQTPKEDTPAIVAKLAIRARTVILSYQVQGLAHENVKNQFDNFVSFLALMTEDGNYMVDDMILNTQQYHTFVGNDNEETVS